MDTLQENVELQRIKKTEEESMVEKTVPVENPTENALIAQDGFGGAPKNQENKGREYGRKTMPVENPTENALIAQDGFGGQVSDKVKTGLGYKVASPAEESFVKSSKMLENQENVKSRLDKGYHAVPSPYPWNYIPTKPNLMFIDEQVKKTKLVRKNNFSPPIIEDWNFDDESEVEFEPKVELKTIRPSIKKIKIVKTARKKVAKYDCDKRVVRPVWNNSRRVNHKNFANKMTHPHLKRRIIPQAILTKSGKLKTTGTPVNNVRPVNTTDSKPIANYSRPISNAFKRGYSHSIRTFNKYSSYKKTIFNKEKEYKEKGVIDSGCSRHMTGNKFYLTDYEDYDGGFVSFRDGKGRISGKGKIKTGTLDFDDVYFCKELKYNMFSVPQMCDKKNNMSCPIF
nr:ribonuclease H-like domain-containing protein [Tanacetum cinerariifolium]